MDIEKIREHCLSKAGVTESFPFDNDTLVFKVIDKMFVLASLEGVLRINLKCDPERVIELQERYTAVLPGYHMNKKHWISVRIDNSIPDKQILEWIDHSYDLVVQKLPASKRKFIH